MESENMDAIKYLRSEHSKFRRTFASISKISSVPKKKTKLKALCNDLVRHEKMEQKAWYPVLKRKVELKTIIKHLLSEETAAAKAIKHIQKTKFEIIWKLRFLKLKHDVDHHAKDEENKLFPKVRQMYSKAELNKLGVKMRKFKAKLK